jgi:flagellar M-ring protein FliF
MGFISKLTVAARLGLAVGLIAILTLVAGAAYWAIRTPYVTIASGLSPDKTAIARKALDTVKIPHRIHASGTAIEVAEKDAGKARSELAAISIGVGGNPGFELFNNTDFSATDFSQKVNFQRALQGELTRTIQAIEGVEMARVHIVLPEGSGLRRRGAKATAAVAVALQPGRIMTQTQVHGVQRLVAAAVPEIKLEDVSVIDFSGNPLSRASGGDAEGMSSQQMERKRESDLYFEGKVSRLLRDALPGLPVSVSANVLLNFDQVKVTTEQALPARTAPEGERDVGVVVKERQVQRNDAKSAGADGEVLNLEIDYKVGQRVEQTMFAPGSIKRLSIAVVVHGTIAELPSEKIADLVAHAVGIDRSRGDSVSVLMLPALTDAPASTWSPLQSSAGVIGVLLALIAIGWVVVRTSFPKSTAQTKKYSEAELADISAQVKNWLNEDSSRAR